MRFVDEDGAEQTDVADPADRRVRICAERCNTCVFRPGNLMRLERNRVRDMVRAAAATNGHITCHKTLNGNPDGLPGAVCQGWIRLRSARDSLVFMAVRMFKRVGLLDTRTGKLTLHDNYRLEGAMGTWGTGPLDSDTALDFRHELAMKATPADREELLSFHLEVLAAHEVSHAVSRTEGDLDMVLDIAVAGCALIAEKLAGEYLYGYRPDPDDTDGDPEFALEMLPEVSVYLLDAATRAMVTAQALVGHPDLAQWDTDQSASAHRAVLRELSDRLYAHATVTPGHPAYVPPA